MSGGLWVSDVRLLKRSSGLEALIALRDENTRKSTIKSIPVSTRYSSIELSRESALELMDKVRFDVDVIRLNKNEIPLMNLKQLTSGNELAGGTYIVTLRGDVALRRVLPANYFPQVDDFHRQNFSEIVREFDAKIFTFLDEPKRRITPEELAKYPWLAFDIETTNRPFYDVISVIGYMAFDGEKIDTFSHVRSNILHGEKLHRLKTPFGIVDFNLSPCKSNLEFGEQFTWVVENLDPLSFAGSNVGNYDLLNLWRLSGVALPGLLIEFEEGEGYHLVSSVNDDFIKQIDLSNPSKPRVAGGGFIKQVTVFGRYINDYVLLLQNHFPGTKDNKLLTAANIFVPQIDFKKSTYIHAHNPFSVKKDPYKLLELLTINAEISSHNLFEFLDYANNDILASAAIYIDQSIQRSSKTTFDEVFGDVYSLKFMFDSLSINMGVHPSFVMSSGKKQLATRLERLKRMRETEELEVKDLIEDNKFIEFVTNSHHLSILRNRRVKKGHARNASLYRFTPSLVVCKQISSKLGLDDLLAQTTNPIHRMVLLNGLEAFVNYPFYEISQFASRLDESKIVSQREKELFALRQGVTIHNVDEMIDTYRRLTSLYISSKVLNKSLINASENYCLGIGRDLNELDGLDFISETIAISLASGRFIFSLVDRLWSQGFDLAAKSASYTPFEKNLIPYLMEVFLDEGDVSEVVNKMIGGFNEVRPIEFDEDFRRSLMYVFKAKKDYDNFSLRSLGNPKTRIQVMSRSRMGDVVTYGFSKDHPSGLISASEFLDQKTTVNVDKYVTDIFGTEAPHKFRGRLGLLVNALMKAI